MAAKVKKEFNQMDRINSWMQVPGSEYQYWANIGHICEVNIENQNITASDTHYCQFSYLILLYSISTDSKSRQFQIIC